MTQTGLTLLLGDGYPLYHESSVPAQDSETNQNSETAQDTQVGENSIRCHHTVTIIIIEVDALLGVFQTIMESQDSGNTVLKF